MNELIAVNFLSAVWSLDRLNLMKVERRMGVRVTFFAAFLLFSRHFFAHPLIVLSAPLAFLVGWATFRQISDAQKSLKQQKQLKTLLDEIIFAMKSGRSLRQALDRAIDGLSESWLKSRMLLRQKEKDLRLNRAGDLRFVPIEGELARLEASPHQALAALESWRLRLCREVEFRVKSRQVTAQLRVQAALLTVFYLCALVFILRQGGFEKFPTLVLLSLILFSSGQALVFWLGRRVKWDF